MVKVAIHQPNYIPWIGYFDKMAKCDVFVFLDSVEYSRNSVINRNKILNTNGWNWLTIPVKKDDTNKNICDVEFANDKWWIKHWTSLVHAYSKSDCFSEYSDFFHQIYDEKKYDKIADLNIAIIRYIAASFEIYPRFIRSSDMELRHDLHKNELLLDILQKLDATQYIAGTGCKDYMEDTLFVENGINIVYNEVKPFVYKQRWEGFEPYMSAVDLLFNEGEKGAGYFTHDIPDD